MGIESSGIDRAGLEKEWANKEARLKLSTADRSLWDSCRYTVRPYVYFDKIFVVWTYLKGQPQVKDILAVTSMDSSFQDGVWVRMVSKVTRHEHLMTHSPRKIGNHELFAWVPYFNEVRFVSADWENLEAPRNLRLCACFKMKGRPEEPVEGVDYLTALHVFRSQWPQYKDTRF